jgi:phage gpG-like protein
MSVKFTDNSDKVLDEFDDAIEVALEEIGLTAEGYAKKECPVDTGRLRNSISHDVKEKTAYIGTNVEYAPLAV